MVRGFAGWCALVVMGLPCAAWSQDAQPPQVVHEPCEHYAKRRAFAVKARFFDESPIFDPKLVYKSRSRRWKTIEFTPTSGGDFQAVIPARQLRGPLLYFIEVYDRLGNGPARYGTAEVPVRLDPRRSPKVCKQIVDFPTPMAPPPDPEPMAQVVEEDLTPQQPLEENVVEEPIAALDADPPPAVPATSQTDEQRLDQALSIQTPNAPEEDTCSAEDSPFYCSGLFWVITSAVVAGGGFGAYWFYFREDAAPQNVTLRVGVPNPAGPGTQALRWRTP